MIALLLAAPAFVPLCGQYNDGCGACSADTMARWEPAAVAFQFDRDTVPDFLGVDAATWSNDIAAALAGWNSVPSSSLVISDGGDAVARDWSGNADAHEIFWSIDDDEWTNFTGFSPAGGAGGVTSSGRAAYDCDADGDGRREPYHDADIILNGTPGSGRVWNCGGLGCPSSTTVLLHEIGHAVGLGHPCRECPDALMGATLIVNAQRPLPDDALSLLALYAVSPDALGVPCNVDDSCASGVCGSFPTPSGTLSYCTQACGTCPSGFSCIDGQCAFDSTPDSFLPDVGDAFSFTCASDCFQLGGPGLIREGCNACLTGVDGPVCVRGCTFSTRSGCIVGEYCDELTGNDEGACKARRDVGEPCDDVVLCLEHLVCEDGACVPLDCSEDPAICPEGSVCELGQCIVPVDRKASEGEGCAVDQDCEDALLCAPTGVCRTPCLDAEDCPSGQICVASTACEPFEKLPPPSNEEQTSCGCRSTSRSTAVALILLCGAWPLVRRARHDRPT